MSIEILHGATIVGFVKDEAFSSWVKKRFATPDEDQDGELSYAEMMKEM